MSFLFIQKVIKTKDDMPSIYAYKIKRYVKCQTCNFQEHATKKAAGLRKSGGDIYNILFLFFVLFC